MACGGIQCGPPRHWRRGLNKRILGDWGRVGETLQDGFRCSVDFRISAAQKIDFSNFCVGYFCFREKQKQSAQIVCPIEVFFSFLPDGAHSACDIFSINWAGYRPLIQLRNHCSFGLKSMLLKIGATGPEFNCSVIAKPSRSRTTIQASVIKRCLEQVESYHPKRRHTESGESRI